MLPANLISALQAISGSGKPLISASAESPKTPLNLEPGQQVQAAVQAKVSEGVYKVQIAGQAMQLRLPGNVQSGDVIRLQVISLRPRITFSMVASANPLSTPEQIGSTAKLLANLAEQPLERQAVQQTGSKAVWEAELVAPEPKQLAAALKETLGKSGLFYEAHQAQWIRGERNINQLLQEPQNLLTGRRPVSAQNNQASTPAFANEGKATLNAGTDQAVRHAGELPQPVARELLTLVQQQLHTLEHHHLVWLGQVWPGQQMQWEIQGEPENQVPLDEQRQWSTEIELALPRLGNVHARLVFAQNGLQLTLKAADPATIATFNKDIGQLRNNLSEAGIALHAAVLENS
ncbi:MAG: flagellar hook-length control protein FliK [Gallionella sp.]